MKKKKDNIRKRLSKILMKWRKDSSLTLYRIAKDEGIRWDYLKRVEDGAGVTDETLLSYLHYCHLHGYDPLSDLWSNDVPVNSFDSTFDNTSASTSDIPSTSGENDPVKAVTESMKTSLEENENEEHKGVCSTTDFAIEQQFETPADSGVKSPESDESQYNRLYHDNTSDDEPVNSSDSTSGNTSANTGDGALTEEKSKVGNEAGTQLENDSDIPSEPSQAASENFHDSFSDSSQIITENNDNNPEVNISEDDEKQLATYNRAMDCFESKQPLDEDLQRAIISFGHQCPKCGKDVELKKGGYVGHCAFVKECDYYAYGTLNNPIIIDKFKKSVMPIELLGRQN